MYQETRLTIFDHILCARHVLPFGVGVLYPQNLAFCSLLVHSEIDESLPNCVQGELAKAKLRGIAVRRPQLVHPRRSNALGSGFCSEFVVPHSPDFAEKVAFAHRLERPHSWDQMVKLFVSRRQK